MTGLDRRISVIPGWPCGTGARIIFRSTSPDPPISMEYAPVPPKLLILAAQEDEAKAIVAGLRQVGLELSLIHI